jgi:hypothetical protein
LNDLAAPTPPSGLAAPAAPGSLADKLQNSLANPTNNVPLTFNDKLRANSNAADAAMTPAQKAQPGAWARSLIAGAQHALGSVEDTLGDAATAASEGPNYGGIAGVVGRIHNVETARKQAQQKAQTEQQKDAALIASTNVQTMYHQTLLHQLSDELNEKDVARGQAKFKAMTTDLAAHHLQPGEVIAKDITESQLTKAINDKSWDPTKEGWMATGSFEVPGKKDASGNPMTQKTYSIVSIPQEQVLDKDTIDRVNTLVPGVNFKYNPDKPDAVKIPGALAWSLVSQADTNELLQNQRDHQIAEAKADKVKSMADDVQLAANDADGRLAKNQEYLKAQSQAHGNLQGIYDYLMTKDPQAVSDLVTSYGGPKNFEKIVADQQEKFIKNDPLTKMENDPAEFSGDKAPAAVALLQSKLVDPNLKPTDKPRVTRLLAQATNAQAQAELSKRREENAKQMAAQGDPDEAAKLLVAGTLTLPELKSRNVTPEFIADVAKRATKIDPTFKAPEAEAQAKIAGSAANQQFFGNTDSLLLKGGTLDQLTSVAKTLPTGTFPKWNEYKQLVSAAVGDSPVARYAAAELGVADDYAKVMGGSVGTDSARSQIMQILNGAQSPDQLVTGVIPQVRQQINSQRQGRMGTNRYMQHMYPDPNPEFSQAQNQTIQQAVKNGTQPGGPVQTNQTQQQAVPQDGAGFFGNFGGKAR